MKNKKFITIITRYALLHVWANKMNIANNMKMMCDICYFLPKTDVLPNISVVGNKLVSIWVSH